MDSAGGTTAPGKLALGGDAKLEFDREGRRLVASARLHRASFELEMNTPPPVGAKLVGGMHVHVLSEMPTETDVAAVVAHPGMAPHFVLGPTWAFRIEGDGTIAAARKRSDFSPRP